MVRRGDARRWFSGALIAVLVVTGCGARDGGVSAPAAPPLPSAAPVATTAPAPTMAPPATPSATATPDTDGLFDVGGYRLFLHCSGAGSPTIVFDSGWGGDSGMWAAIFGTIRRDTRACVYDRAGLGRSEPGPLPRTSARMVGELHALLAKAGERGPLLLVGHSFGGFNMRLYTGTYPQDVAGLILVDSSHEDQDARTLAVLPAYSPDENSRLTAYRDALDTDVVAGPEPVAFKTSAAQVRAVRDLGALPLIVLMAGRTVFTGFPPEMAAQLDRVAHDDLQHDLARLSTNSRVIVATESGHCIPCDQPALVVDAVVTLAARTRR